MKKIRIVSFALALLLMVGMFSGCKPTDPKDILTTAFKATLKDIQEKSDAQAKDYPLMALAKELQDKEGYSVTTDMKFISMSGVDEAQYINALLSGSGFTSVAEIDLKNAVTSAEVDVSLMGTSLAGIYLYMSNDAMAIGLPGLCQTVLSIDPSNLEQQLIDMGYLTQADLNQLDMDSLTASLSGESLINADFSKFSTAIEENWQSLLDNSKIEKAGDTYTIKVPPEAAAVAVKATIDALYDALVEIMPAIKDELAKEDLTSDIYIDFETEIKVTLNKDNLVTGVLVSLLDTDGTAPITAEVNIDGGSYTIDINVVDGADKVAISLSHKVEESKIKDNVTFKVKDVTGEYPVFAVDFVQDKNGEVSMDINLANAMSIKGSGLISRSGKATVVDFPEITVAINDGYQNINMKYSIKSSMSDLGGAVTPKYDFTPALELTEDDYQMLLMEIMTNLYTKLDAMGLAGLLE